MYDPLECLEHKVQSDIHQKWQAYEESCLKVEPDVEVVVQLLPAWTHVHDEAEVGHEEEAHWHENDHQCEPGVVLLTHQEVQTHARDNRELHSVGHVETEVGALDLTGAGDV